MGFGVLIRDEQGNILAAKCLMLVGNMDVSVVEARGVKAGSYLIAR
jgi:hypothetical protein